MNLNNLSAVMFFYLLFLPIMVIVGIALIPRFYSNEKYKNILRVLRWFCIIVLVPLSLYITGSLLSLLYD
jgi:Mn2+/Fe2+ NRAMP family transporter